MRGGRDRRAVQRQPENQDAVEKNKGIARLVGLLDQLTTGPPRRRRLAVLARHRKPGEGDASGIAPLVDLLQANTAE